MTAFHILVVDDDLGIRKLLKKFLEENGYIVSSASNVKECRFLITQFIFDLIIMDIMMPGETGIKFLKNTKHLLQTPVLLLSALGNVDDRINGLESGAEEYLAKPFEPKELLLRIQNILKRVQNNNSSKCSFGSFEFDLQSGNLNQGDEQIHLTNTEKKLLTYLIAHKGQTVNRESLKKIFDEVHSRSIDAQVARLRSKIEADSKNPIYLQSVRGIGYVFWT